MRSKMARSRRGDAGRSLSKAKARSAVALSEAPIATRPASNETKRSASAARARRVTRRPVRGPHRILKERVLDVREQELLVLHFVVQSELDAVGDLGPARPFERGAHALVDRFAVVKTSATEGARSMPRRSRGWRSPTAS